MQSWNAKFKIVRKAQFWVQASSFLVVYLDKQPINFKSQSGYFAKIG